MTTKDVNAAIWAIEAPESVKRGILGPMYTRSIDASMAVIQRRWPGVTVEIGLPIDGDTVVHLYGVANNLPAGEARKPAHALALALLAALEAETKP